MEPLETEAIGHIVDDPHEPTGEVEIECEGVD